MNSIQTTGIGELLCKARITTGLSQEALGLELRLPTSIIQAIEDEEWSCIPPGRERPLTRLMAHRLNVNLEECSQAFEAIPGGQIQEEPHPKQELLERILTGAVTLASLALLVWLVVPGRSLKERMPVQVKDPTLNAPLQTTIPKTYSGPYPVLGEVLPDVPINEEGILVNIRSVDTCEVHIVGPGTDLKQSMRVSEPWRLRVKGPFTLSLDNAGVVNLLVAGRPIQSNRAVGEAWTGNFDEMGILQIPVEKINTEPAGVPDADEPEPGADTAPDPGLPEKKP